MRQDVIAVLFRSLLVPFRRASVRVCAALVCAASVAAIAQDAETPRPQQPTFRGGANFVRVDMYPVIDGRLVTDLRRDEIEVFEDGVRQEIETFEHVRIPPGGPEALRVEPNSIRASQQAAADPRARVFVVFLDTYHMDVQVAQQLSNPVRRFLEEALGPDDLVAVLPAEMPTTALAFTRRTAVLSGLLDQTGEWMQRDATIHRFNEQERMYDRCYGNSSPIAREMIARRREKLALDGVEQLSEHLGVLREERKTVLLVTKGWQLFEPSDALANSSPLGGAPLPPDDRLRGGRSRDGQNDVNSTAEMRQCEADRIALAQLDHRGRMQQITGVANRSNVSFYPLSPLRVETTQMMLSNLRGLAEDTDGIAVVNTNNLGEPMRRIIADTSSYYLVGYQSSNAALDGRFRRITVRVARPGVQVRARRGYRAISSAELRTAAAIRAPARPPSPVTGALGRVASADTAAPLKLRAATWSPTAAGAGARVWITGEIEAATARQPSWAGGGRADVTLLSREGETLASESIDIPKGSTAFASAITAPTLSAGDYTVRVRVSPSASGEPLSDLARATVPASAPLGDAVLFRRGPQTGIRYVPTADVRFRRNERLRLELPTGSAAQPAARLLDRMGNPLQVPLQVTSRDDAAGAIRWVVVDATLAPLAAGDYVIEITQDGTTQLVAFRMVT